MKNMKRKKTIKNIKRKETKLTTLNSRAYKKLEIQAYLNCKLLGKKEIKLMSLLILKCPQSKSNF